MSDRLVFARRRWAPFIAANYPTGDLSAVPMALFDRVFADADRRVRQLNRWTADHPDTVVPVAPLWRVATAMAVFLAERPAPTLGQAIELHDDVVAALDLFDPMYDDHDELEIPDHDPRR